MPADRIHRFVKNERRFAIDTQTCFCFECDAISWDVLEYYPESPVNRIVHELGGRYDPDEIHEVLGELEWLRATKSILPNRRVEERNKEFEVQEGLRKLSIQVPAGSHSERAAKARWFRRGEGNGSAMSDAVVDAISMLFARAAGQKRLELEFIERGAVSSPRQLAGWCQTAARMAGLAGKTISIGVVVEDLPLSKVPDTLVDHRLSVKLESQDAEALGQHLKAFSGSRFDTIERLAKSLNALDANVSARVIVRPGHGGFGGVVQTLHEAGFPAIELDVDGAFVDHPELDPKTVLHSMEAAANYYAECLRKHDYYRVDPIASLFWRIYNGTAIRRYDPSGTNALAIDDDGGIYPSPYFFGNDTFRVGAVHEGGVDENALKVFDDVGAVTTSACVKCWARNICGGGTAAVHQALTGSIRHPHEAWCDAQREWINAAVSAFNLLASSGVNFTRVYHSLNRRAKPSLFQMARAAFRMSIGVRPLDEADAAMLADWESWNRSAYFLLNERAVFIGNRYDREMDALHPRPMEYEVVLLHKKGTPFGLLKVRPEKLPGVAEAFIYFHEDESYDSDSVRKGFQTIVKEAAGQQSVRRLVAYAAPWEEGLQRFLDGVGFESVGTMREALYTKGAYHDVHTYVYNVS